MADYSEPEKSVMPEFEGYKSNPADSVKRGGAKESTPLAPIPQTIEDLYHRLNDLEGVIIEHRRSIDSVLAPIHNDEAASVDKEPYDSQQSDLLSVLYVIERRLVQIRVDIADLTNRVQL